MKRRDPMEKIKLMLAETRANKQLVRELRKTVRRWRKRPHRLIPRPSVNKIARRWNWVLRLFG